MSAGGSMKRIRRGTIVKVRDFQDEHWELGWYVEYVPIQKAHRVQMEKGSTINNRLYNFAVPIQSARKREKGI